MIRPGHRVPVTLWGLALLWTMFALASPQLATAASRTPLPESDYTTRSACSAPTPGHASCMALELEPKAAVRQARGNPLAPGASVGTGMKTLAECQAEFPSACLTPQNLRSAYFPSEEPDAPASHAQTIALVDAYNDPKAEADLAVYDKEFGLPAMHACGANEGGCFEQVNQNGTGALPFPRSEVAREVKETVCVTEAAKESETELKKREEACTEVVEAEGWAIEISTDIEVTHAVCQNCKILLVEASVPSYPDLEAAEETAVRLGATEISNSWGGPQEGASGQTFNHPGIVITAAAGDAGYLNWTEIQAAEEAKLENQESGYFPGADYPAVSPDVVAVGGTKLTLAGGVRQSETVWNEDPDSEGANQGAGGGGCSESFTASPWQQAVPDWSSVGCDSKRAVADVSADADPYTGVAVYDSVPTIQERPSGEVVNEPPEWWPIGGTSVSSPMVASMFALAGGAHGVEYPAQTLYSHLGSALLHDVTVGGNGACDDNYLSCSGSMDPLSPLDCGADTWICNATSGYDGPTGVGTPNGIGAFKPSEEGAQKSKLGEEPGKSKGSAPEGGETKESVVNTGGGSPGQEGSGEGSSSSSTAGGSSTPGVTPGSSSHSSKTARPTPRISALLLTANARAALRYRPLMVSSLAFSCTMSQATTIRVTLAVQVRSGGHTHWHRLPTSLTFAAIKGTDRRRLHGSGVLAPGLYRLTLTPIAGMARSIAIRVP